jgi:hypothetical protein
MSITPPSPRDTEALRKIVPPDDLAFEIRKIGYDVEKWRGAIGRAKIEKQ